MKLFKNIYEIPLFNWIMINEEKDYGYFNSDGSKIFDVDECNKRLDEMNNEIVKITGYSDEFLILFNMEKEYNKMVSDVIIKKEDELYGLINKKKKEIETFASSLQKGNVSMWDSVASLSKAMGFQVDLKATSVREYISFSMMLKKIVEDGKSN